MIKRLFLATTIIFGIVSTNADNSTNTSESDKTILLSYSQNKGNIKRPHSPSKKYILCSMGNDYMTFFLPEDCTWAEVTISNKTEIYLTTIIYQNCSSIDISSLSDDDEYDIILSLDNGASYYGCF